MRVAPMLAVPGTLPPDDGRWAAEVKWDGVRLLVEHGRAWTRRGADATARWPELAVVLALTATLDGEVVALDPATGRPSFSLLQQRMHVIPSPALQAAVPAVFLAFDLLEHAGRDLLAEPYDRRREALLDLAARHPALSVPAAADSAAALLAATREQGLEGIVAKRRDSSYQPGRRSPDWRKVKNHRMQAVVIGGFTPGAGSRAGTLGSLLVGTTRNDELHYAGHVGTGLDAAALALLLARMVPTGRCPFAPGVPAAHARQAIWVRPDLVGEVRYTEWTPDGRLRHPSWRGLREDLTPAEAHREP